MKRTLYKLSNLILILTMVFFLCSCASADIYISSEEDSDTYIQNEDYQNFLDSFSGFVKVDGGYYFINDSTLSFYDTQSKDAYPACNKANCSHSDENCQAYLSAETFYPGMGMFYYNNALYLLGHESDGTSRQQVFMYRISLENYKRSKAAYLFDGTSGISIACIVHRGYVYFTNDGGQSQETTATLQRVKLGETSEKSAETIFEYTAIGASIANITAYGNNIFFNTSSYSDEQGNGYQTVLNYMDINTSQVYQISERKYSHFASENGVYYFKDENTVKYFDIKTQESTFFCTSDCPCYISADSNYVYFDNLQSITIGLTEKAERKITVYDKYGNYVTEIIPRNANDDCYFGGDDIMIFKEVTDDEVTDENATDGCYVLYKSQLKSSDKEFVDMN